MTEKKFDLNIEKILESWEPAHAVREIIANALDEELLTDTEEIKIFKRPDGAWCIRDFGRGLNYFHLTQNENQEKQKHPKVIGNFGIGLKDALATLDRNSIDVEINSSHQSFRTARLAKGEFGDVTTLHAVIGPAKFPDMKGTEFILKGLADEDMEKAKQLFLRFTESSLIESTSKGDIIGRDTKNDASYIYINGVKVAEEANFLFSYNITYLDAKIRKSLNRERTNVGRSAYTEAIKRILKKSNSRIAAFLLANDLKRLSENESFDELSWVDVQIHAISTLNALGDYIFVTNEEVVNNTSIIDDAKNEGRSLIVIPKNLKAKIDNVKDASGNAITSLENFLSAYNESFSFEFCEADELSERKKYIWSFLAEIVDLYGGLPERVREIKLSKTMRKTISEDNTLGCWDPLEDNIVISVKALDSLECFAGTLMHELVHAKTNFHDVTREFENELTELIGKLTVKLLN